MVCAPVAVVRFGIIRHRRGVLIKQFVGDDTNIVLSHEPRERDGLVNQTVVVVGRILDAATHGDIPAIGSALAVARLSDTSMHVNMLAQTGANAGDKQLQSKRACECMWCQ